MPLIAIIVFAFAVMFIGVNREQAAENNYQQINLQQMTYEAAKEFSQFTKASGEYVQSIGLPLDGTQLSVSDLQNVNLLPSSFPLETPFGQTLVADYVTDPLNHAALDVVTHTTGQMNVALMERSGLGANSIANIQYQTASIAQNQIPTNIIGSTGQFFGIADGSSIENIGSSSSQVLPSGVNTQQPEVTELIVSPGQYGYWLIGVSTYGNGTVWNDTVGLTPAVPNTVDNWYPIDTGETYIGSQGFSLICPSVAVNLGNYSNNQIQGNNDTEYQSNTNDASQSPLFCIPAYKGQVQALSLSPNVQTFQSQTIWWEQLVWDGQYYVNPTNPQFYSSNVNYVNQSSIVGLNNNLYATGSFSYTYQPYPTYPSNEALPTPMPNAIFGEGVAISSKTPQGTTDIYQIEIDDGALFTGTGCGDFLVDPSTGAYNYYSVWATGNSNQNLCGSQETFWTDWHAVKNSSNTQSMAISQPYSAYGNTYYLNFNVATPLAN